MKVNILIFGTLFLIGNITLSAQEYTREAITLSEKSAQKHTQQGLQNDLKERLVNRGLDEEYADELAQNICTEDEIISTLKIHHYLAALQNVSYHDFMEEIASRALFKKSIDLGNYDTLVGLTQKLKSHHIDEATLEKLSNVALMNHNLNLHVKSS